MVNGENVGPLQPNEEISFHVCKENCTEEDHRDPNYIQDEKYRLWILSFKLNVFYALGSTAWGRNFTKSFGSNFFVMPKSQKRIPFFVQNTVPCAEYHSLCRILFLAQHTVLYLNGEQSGK